MALAYNQLSDEQQLFIRYALAGHNVLVNACIGSGKTTAIQALCDMMGQNKRILYLTYSKLLKLDAQAKIQNRPGRLFVTNYHGFCYRELARIRVKCGMGDLVQTYNRVRPPTDKYDVLILDEYQDIEQELAEMLKHVKACNPGLQIIAVGDMDQKIYDKTRLNVPAFMAEFMDGGWDDVEFTNCFRLPPGLADFLGDVWGKKIHGVNRDCDVMHVSFKKAFQILSHQDPSDILCVGSNTGARTRMLNCLEEEFPDVFNKYTVWAKVSDKDGGATSPGAECAVFTTYDGCKGMERDVCAVFDWTEEYWDTRIEKPQARYEILRNVFCVAASRGKRMILFVESPRGTPLSKDTLMDSAAATGRLDDMAVTEMFEYKYAEDVEAAYGALEIKELRPRGDVIDAATKDALIDLSFCVGVYQEALYFDGCDIDRYIESYFENNPDSAHLRRKYETWPLESKVLYLASLETGQQRYARQVRCPFIDDDVSRRIEDRLSTLFPRDAEAQTACHVSFYKNGNCLFTANGFSDVIMSDTVYELKFVTELQHTHFLQCAMYMIARGLRKGVVYNTRDDSMFSVVIPDMERFMDLVAAAATKGFLNRYEGPALDVFGQSGTGTAVVDRKAAVLQFCETNRDACREVILAMLSARKAGKTFGLARIERAFRDRGLQLPVSNKTFVKYWYPYVEELSGSDFSS